MNLASNAGGYSLQKLQELEETLEIRGNFREESFQPHFKGQGVKIKLGQKPGFRKSRVYQFPKEELDFRNYLMDENLLEDNIFVYLFERLPEGVQDSYAIDFKHFKRVKIYNEWKGHYSDKKLEKFEVDGLNKSLGFLEGLILSS